MELIDPGRNDDLELMADVADALREVRPLARTLTGRSGALYSWRTVDDELAALVHGSCGGSPGCEALARRDPLSVEVAFRAGALHGQVIPPSVAEILVESRCGTLDHASSDERGVFQVTPSPDEPVRLHCTTTTDHLVTDWLHRPA